MDIVIKSYHVTPHVMCKLRQFDSPGGARLTDLRDAETKAKNQAADDEEGNVEADGDQGDAEEHGEAADDDAGSAAVGIDDPRRDGDGKNAADVHYGHEQTEGGRARVVIG